MKKINLIIVGISIAVILELSLSLTGKILFFIRSRDLSFNNRGFTRLICCIGDSHTFGVGTSYRYSYPKQLETLLNLNNQKIKFRVVNLGIPGDSTQCQIERLSSFLSKHKTDIAILLTGRNNENEIQSWQIRDTFFKRFTKRLKNMKIYKITEYAIGCFLKPKAKIQQDNITIKTKYENYIRYQLMKAKNLCEKHNCKLLLLSYYDGPDEYIEKFAEKSGIFYFDISKDFQRAVPEYELSHFLSPDKSHMNRRGYRIFSELLYQQLFSHQASLGLKLNVLLKTTDEASFYKNTTEANDGITAQQKRIREMPRNPYELIQLGHIYMEINEKQKARQCYIKALEQSGYADNNTIVSPIINWYLGENMPEEAYKICHKIIAHNKDSCIATCYLDYIKEKYRYVEE